jgi:glycosyltransferase involved in cell wall biosynthesis
LLPVYFISQLTLENWDYDSPFSTGIGGSETAHIECAIRLAKRGYAVTSWCPLPAYKAGRIHKGVKWLDCTHEAFPKEPCIIINYRNPVLFDRKKPKGQVWWFVAQDVDYDGHWTEQAAKNTDRFLALCPTHANFTQDKYPNFRGKTYISTNGVRTDYIEKLPPLERQPHRMFWASSPDRGLLLLLENWFRIRERFPDAELRIAYGFNNMDTIINFQGAHSPLIPLRQQLRAVAEQPGVKWLGRLTQDKVFAEWQQASVFPYCSDFPETSCVSIMEAMACGAIPVTTNFWAQGHHAGAAPLAYVVDGLPQKSDLVRCLWLEQLYEALENKNDRFALMKWARQRYDWERVIDQWEGWLKVDMVPQVKAVTKRKGKK